MSRHTIGVCRLCRRTGDKLFLKGERCYSEKCAFARRGYPPGQHGQGRRKPSPYCEQLREKQKVRWSYGMQERPFRRFFSIAERQKGVTGENLLRLLECRLDNVAYRAGFASNRADGRQLVSHGHLRVNGRRVTIPSFVVRTGDVITVTPKSAGLKRIVESMKSAERRTAVRWIETDRQGFKATVVAMPGREDIDQNLKEEAVVELYSK